MKRLITTLALAATMVLGTASVALAAPNGNAACYGAGGAVNVANHGKHILGYVNDGDSTPPGVRGRASHSGSGLTPGATFCKGKGGANAAMVGIIP